MGNERIVVEVYGAEQICASCVNLPSSRETAEWLEMALTRKYGSQVEIQYIDLFQPKNDREQRFCEKILREDLWYPVVVIGEEIVAEGNPKLKQIYQLLEQQGITAEK